MGTGHTEVYLRDGAITLGVFTVNGSGTPTTWLFNLVWEGRVIGRQPNTGNRRYYHFDHLGSTRAVVEGAAIVESYDFEPWGLLMPGRTLAGPTKEGFTSKERDTETGLDYFGARYYMPALGRWAAVDPLSDATPEWSPYNYTLNNPILHTDPDGRQVDVKATNAFWDQVAIEGHQRGGVGGFLQAAAATMMTTFIDYGGLNLMDRGTDAAIIEGEVLKGVGQTTLGVLQLAPIKIPGLALADDGARAAGQAVSHLDDAGGAASRPLGRAPGPTVDPGTGGRVGRFSVDSKGNAMIEPAGPTLPNRTVPAGRGGRDTHTLYPNGSNAQRLNPQGHAGNPTPHGHGHLPGSGPGKAGQGPSITPTGRIVKPNSPDAHWRINN